MGSQKRHNLFTNVSRKVGIAHLIFAFFIESSKKNEIEVENEKDQGGLWRIFDALSDADL